MTSPTTSPPPQSVADSRPRVLFIAHDASSPQIAAGLLSQVAQDRVRVDTASTQPEDPGGHTDELLVAMGLNPAEQQRISVRNLNRADRVISLGVGLDVARIGRAHYEEWDLASGDLIARVEALGHALLNPPKIVARPTPRARLRALLGAARRR